MNSIQKKFWINAFICGTILILSLLGVYIYVDVVPGVILITLSTLTGLIFALSITSFQKYLLARTVRNIELEPYKLLSHEFVLADGPFFSRTKEDPAVGKLFLTTRRLVLMHQEPGKAEKQIVLGNITRIELVKKINLISGELKLTCKDSTEVLMVDYPSDWKKVMETQIKILKEKE